MNTEIKLGLCNPPEPVYLYVKSGKEKGESYLWYHYNIDNDESIPVFQRGLAGYLVELRVTAKEYEGKDSNKLDIIVAADELYIVRTGIETNFAKTFLLAASVVEDFSKPILIGTVAGQKNTVFCRLYDAQSKIRFKREWDNHADWFSIIASIQSKLSGSPKYELEEDIPTTKLVSAKSLAQQQQPLTSDVHPHDTRIKQIRTLLDYPVDLVKEWLHFQDVKFPSQLPTNKVDELVKTMCLAWAADKLENPNHVQSSYTEQVLGAIASGTDETAALKAWMNYVVGQKTVVSSR